MTRTGVNDLSGGPEQGSSSAGSSAGAAVRNPRVSIGLPVYNGENFLAQAIESILGQTFTDFELIISDNASTDRTEEIARSYAAIDRRIRFVRHGVNCGASKNWNLVFELARGEYFKWAAHDDVCLPDFLTECVALLDDDPSAVLSCSRTSMIDGSGQAWKQLELLEEYTSPAPHIRYRGAFSDSAPFALFGLIRSHILRKTPLVGSYPSFDRPLLAELALYGRFVAAPKVLFCLRHHTKNSPRNSRKLVTWLDPNLSSKLVFPEWRLLWEYLAPTLRCPLSLRQRLDCWRYLRGRTRKRGRALRRELIAGSLRLPVLGRFFRARIQRGEEQWRNQTERFVAALRSHVPPGKKLLLVDEMKLDSALFESWRTSHFPVVQGEYFGPPFDDEHALGALEQMRRPEGGFLVVAWNCFWWLHYYTGFHRVLREQFPCVLENELAIVFDLTDR